MGSFDAGDKPPSGDCEHTGGGRLSLIRECLAFPAICPLLSSEARVGGGVLGRHPG